MMNSKKGLSDIVTNVLIILLVLVAVGIIWAFLQPTISSGAGQLGGAGDCLTVQVEPVSCNVVDNQVTIRRGAGSGDLQDVKIIVGNSVYDASDDTATFGSEFSLTELQSRPITVTDETDGVVDLVSGNSISVAAVVADGEGGQRTCNEAPVTITCTA